MDIFHLRTSGHFQLRLLKHPERGNFDREYSVSQNSNSANPNTSAHTDTQTFLHTIPDTSIDAETLSAEPATSARVQAPTTHPTIRRGSEIEVFEDESESCGVHALSHPTSMSTEVKGGGVERQQVGLKVRDVMLRSDVVLRSVAADRNAVNYAEPTFRSLQKLGAKDIKTMHSRHLVHEVCVHRDPFACAQVKVPPF